MTSSSERFVPAGRATTWWSRVTCEWCGDDYLAGRGTRYCSIRCAINAHTHRHPTPPSRHLANSTHRGYDHTWRTLRLAILERDANTCLIPIDEHGNYDPTSAILCAYYADTVDHVIEFNGLDDPLRLDPDNLRAACRRHNSQKAAANTNAKRRQART